MSSTLTVAQVAQLRGWDTRRTWRAFRRWQAAGWPRVEVRPRADGRHGGELHVDAAEYHAVARGELTSEPVAA